MKLYTFGVTAELVVVRVILQEISLNISIGCENSNFFQFAHIWSVLVMVLYGKNAPSFILYSKITEVQVGISAPSIT